MHRHTSPGVMVGRGIVCLAFLLAACRHDALSSEGPYATEGAYAWTPPSSYRDAWESAEYCTGIQGDFDRVQWYIVPDDSFYSPYGDKYVWGMWQKPHAIYLSEKWLNEWWLVRHEAVHDLTQSGRHTRVPFFDPCRVITEKEIDNGTP